ncbi:MAG: hypothetical protein DHS20C18_27560 [Saprospiraceae bacterium]|nr:MAG: hypothetical protein DHS20C18_27560 [Saprospiraceae bacterium]
MEVMGEMVFALDDGKVRGFNLASGMEEMTLTIEGASFLNGLTNDGAGILYATDFSARKIYKIDVTDIDNPSYEVIVENTVKTPNGILFDGEKNRLLWVTWGSSASIRAVDLSDFSLSTIQTTSLSNIDGIDEDNDQNYYISSWLPARITKYDKDFINDPEIVTTPMLSNPADIGYSKVTDTLAIPMGVNVIYVGLAPVTSMPEFNIGDYGLSVFPNPVSESSFIQFELPVSQTLELAIYDMKGALIQNLLTGKQPMGLHKVVLAGISLVDGTYLCKLMTKEGEHVLKFVVGKS